MHHPLLGIDGPFGTLEMVLLAVVILLLFGTQKLPNFASDLKRAWQDFWRHLP